MTESEASLIIASITRGIDYCHSHGIIHHDLKPENILIKTNRRGEIKRIKLADFGLSRKTIDKLEAGADSRGTLQYAAPEMLQIGKSFD